MHLPRVREALKAGLALVTDYLCDISPAFERSDVHAQLLRARVQANHHAGMDIDHDAGVQTISRITSFQHADEDVRIHGGFWFGSREGKLLPYVNPVSTAFCLQALDTWQEHLAGHQPDCRSLI
ncbi:MAG: hypothetical protein WKF37_02520 [Bryobacteraceae bacterium]